MFHDKQIISIAFIRTFGFFQVNQPKQSWWAYQLGKTQQSRYREPHLEKTARLVNIYHSNYPVYICRPTWFFNKIMKSCF